MKGRPKLIEPLPVDAIFNLFRRVVRIAPTLVVPLLKFLLMSSSSKSRMTKAIRENPPTRGDIMSLFKVGGERALKLARSSAQGVRLLDDLRLGVAHVLLPDGPCTDIDLPAVLYLSEDSRFETVGVGFRVGPKFRSGGVDVLVSLQIHDGMRNINPVDLCRSWIEVYVNHQGRLRQVMLRNASLVDIGNGEMHFAVKFPD